jgi:phosphoglycerate dehydrogenase-like enzyme
MPDPATPFRDVLITAPGGAEIAERIRSSWPNVRVETVRAGMSRTLPTERWRSVDVLYTSFATTLPSPDEAPRLRWVQLYSAGPDAIVDHPLYRSPVTFTSASGVHAITMAEHVMAMVLAWYHHLPLQFAWQREARWPTPTERSRFTAEELPGKTIGIVGYGSIGRQVGRLASGFGMRVVAMQRGSDHRDHGFLFEGIGDPDGVIPDRYYGPEQLHELLGACDVVVLTAPLTSRTRGMLDAAAFHAMKPTAFFVNIARGGLCDEAALLHALSEGQIAGAALDVFQQEPLPADNPFWRIPNVFISSHTACLSRYYEARAAAIFQENLRRYLAGEPLANVVDKSRGY